MSKKSFTLIGIGIFQLIHGLTHLYPIVASFMHVADVQHPLIDGIWVVFGIISMYIGYKEYKIHKTDEKEYREAWDGAEQWEDQREVMLNAWKRKEEKDD